MELDDAIYDRVTALSQEGNRHMDMGNWSKARTVFEQALTLLPDPKDEWEAATWLNASLGDANFAAKDYMRARTALIDALNCPDGQANAFIHLRLGEVSLELGEPDRAREHLLRAYMLGGEELFASEPPRYRQFIRPDVDRTQ